MRTVACPACGKELRIPDTDEFVRLRCPHCAHEFEHGVASAEVLSEPAEAVVLPPQAQPASAPATSPETSGSDFTPGEKVGCTVMVLVALLVVFGATWFLSEKRSVVVIELGQSGPVVAESYYYAPAGRLLGGPALIGRLVGLQPPSEIEGPGGRTDIPRIADDAHEANDTIIVNQTKGDITYSAFVYGDADKVDKNAVQGPIRIAPGDGAAVLGKSHGEYQFGCADIPGDSERFNTSSYNRFSFAVLGWIGTMPPQDCPAGDGKGTK